MEYEADRLITSKGKAAYLLKGSSKKKRTRDEIEEVKHEEEKLSENKQEFLRKHKRLRGVEDELERTKANVEANEELLNRLFEEGVIDNNGNILMPGVVKPSKPK